MALNTHGLAPLPKIWKLFEVDGWQCLVALEENQEDDTMTDVAFSVGFDATGAPTSVRITSNSEAAARIIFDAVEDGEKAIQMVLDQAGPLISKVWGAA